MPTKYINNNSMLDLVYLQTFKTKTQHID